LPDEGHHQRSSEVIKGYEWSSEVRVIIRAHRGHQSSSELRQEALTVGKLLEGDCEREEDEHLMKEAIRGPQRSSEIIRAHQSSSVAATRGHQRSSEVMRSHQWSSVMSEREAHHIVLRHAEGVDIRYALAHETHETREPVASAATVGGRWACGIPGAITLPQPAIHSQPFMITVAP
jgi:hypothetical protein